MNEPDREELLPTFSDRYSGHEDLGSGPSWSEVILGLFDQGEKWIDEGGDTYYVRFMSTVERARLAGWLGRNAEHFYGQILIRHVMVRRSNGAPEIPAMAAQSAVQWLFGTELFQALTGGLGLPETVFEVRT